MEEQVTKFLQIAYAQSCKAAEQFYKKLNDYLEMVPKIEEFIKNGKDSSKNYKFTYTASLIWPILEHPNEIDEKLYTLIQKLRDGAESFSGLIALSGQYCSLVEVLDQKKLITSFEKLRKFYSQGEIFQKKLWDLGLIYTQDDEGIYELLENHYSHLKQELDSMFNQLLDTLPE